LLFHPAVGTGPATSVSAGDWGKALPRVKSIPMTCAEATPPDVALARQTAQAKMKVDMSLFAGSISYFSEQFVLFL